MGAEGWGDDETGEMTGRGWPDCWTARGGPPSPLHLLKNTTTFQPINNNPPSS